MIVRHLILMVGYMRLVLIIILFPVIIYSQTGIIKGKVVGEVNEGKLLGANVILIGTKLGCATDNDGKYKIVNITAGKYVLRCTYIGYKPEQQQIDVKKGEEIEVDFKLKAEINSSIVKDLTFPNKRKDKKKIIPIPPAILPPIRQAELLPLYKPGNLDLKLLKKKYKKY